MTTEVNKGAVKIVGYLEKKGRLKVVTTWKKYWFVLEGRLLLYYRSQEEYDNLSPCKGSINMGLATNIRPGLATAGVFQIITRTNTITLRAKERCIQEKWLQALLDASGQQTASNPIKMSHFRYSMDDLIPTGAKASHQQTQPHQKPKLTRQNTLPNRLKVEQTSNNNNRKASQELSDRGVEIIDRIRMIGGQTYGGSLDQINKLIPRNKPTLSVAEEEGDNQNEKMDENSPPRLSKSDSDPDNDEVFEKNDLYHELIVRNSQYASTDKSLHLQQPSSERSSLDHNKNSLLIENDQYIKIEDVAKSKPSIADIIEDDIEYYCTYEELHSNSNNEPVPSSPTTLTPKTTAAPATTLESDVNKIYYEPNLPPRPELKSRSESDDSGSVCDVEKPKKTVSSKFVKFTKRFKSIKSDEKPPKKNSTNLLQKVIGRKKSSSDQEHIYDTIKYVPVKDVKNNSAKEEKSVPNHNENIVKTLMELQETLQVKKTHLKDIIESFPKENNADSSTNENESYATNGDASSGKDHNQKMRNSNSSQNAPEITSSSNSIEETIPPGLPPRRGSNKSRSRSKSPYHDYPKNNSPVTQTSFVLESPLVMDTTMTSQLLHHQQNYSIDKILNDLEIESKINADIITDDQEQNEELSVRQLIKKFNSSNNATSKEGQTSMVPGYDPQQSMDVFLRQKSEDNNSGTTELISSDHVASLMNRYSDDLNKLLEELAKVTSAPLLTPGVTSSLVQMKSPTMTDEEWLAITPIRRRRHSEPDYDVPRPHRSLQILPQSPDKSDNEDNTVIPATRFFGPVLSPPTTSITTMPTEQQSMSWRSMTPDSLEPLHTVLQTALKKHQNNRASFNSNYASDTERDRSVVEVTDDVSDCSSESINVSQIYPHHNNGCKNNLSYNNSNLTNDYLDSLEPFNEGATAF